MRGWGQFDAAGAVEAVRRLDDTRLVDEASGWYDQGGGDVDSLHNYFYPLRVGPRSRVVAPERIRRHCLAHARP